MSRIYEALRQSELERGATGTLLDPDTFPAPPITRETQEAEQSPARNALAWNEIGSFEPILRPENRLVALTDDNSLGAEKFRLLRARLRHLQDQQHIKKIVITSAVPDEGKTVVSMNLAISLAKHTTQKVLLLEGDLRKPILAERLGMPDFPGLEDWFRSTEPITKFIYQVKGLQLGILPAGAPSKNPLSILQSPRFLELYQLLSSRFDWVLVDAPPLLPMADVNFWSRQADGLLLVLREGKASKKILEKGLESLDNPKVIGVVLNDAYSIEHGHYKRYYTTESKPDKATA
jgi:capsular exopolysaccharide synthesis family protein